MQRRIDTRLRPPSTAPADNIISNQAQATIPTKVAFDEKGELEQVNVLYSFLENRYTKTVRVELLPLIFTYTLRGCSGCDNQQSMLMGFGIVSVV